MADIEQHLAKDYFDRFATTTVIRVFNFIRTAEFLFERLFWVCVLLGFSGATLWSLSLTFQNFLSEPTASKLYYVDNSSRGLLFENAAMCLEMSSVDLIKLYEGDIDRVIAYIANSSNVVENLTQKLRLVEGAEEERASFISAIVEAKKPTAELATYHAFNSATYALFTQTEVALVALTTVMFVRLIDLEADPKPFYPEWQQPSIRRLFYAYVETRTDFSALFDITVEATCVLYQIRIVTSYHNLKTGLKSYKAYNFCKDLPYDENFGIFGKSETICYPLAAKQGEAYPPLAFYSMFDSVIITLHAEAIYRELVADLVHISVDLSGTILIAGAQQPVSPSFNAKQAVDIALDTLSTSANLRRRPCAMPHVRKGTHDDCIYWCRVESIVRACGCSPISEKLQPEFGPLPTLPSCAVSFGADFAGLSEQCRAVLAVNCDTLNCSVSCIPNCETYLFTSNVRPGGVSLDTTNATTVISMKALKFLYQNAEEYVTMDSRGFISALGGNLSLYLGASFLALIHIVVFFLRIPFERFCRKQPINHQSVTLTVPVSPQVS